MEATILLLPISLLFLSFTRVSSAHKMLCVHESFSVNVSALLVFVCKEIKAKNNTQLPVSKSCLAY